MNIVCALFQPGMGIIWALEEASNSTASNSTMAGAAANEAEALATFTGHFFLRIQMVENIRVRRRSHPTPDDEREIFSNNQTTLTLTRFLSSPVPSVGL